MTKRRRGRDVGREAVWRERLSRQAVSGLSIRAFCRGEGVGEPSFYFWRCAIAERDAARAKLPECMEANPAFVPVVLAALKLIRGGESDCSNCAPQHAPDIAVFRQSGCWRRIADVA